MQKDRVALRRRVQMKRTFNRVVILPCLCCVSFYSGIQIVGETEASFSSQVSSDPIAMSAAFVFPATIKQLEEYAQEIAKLMHVNFETIIATSPGSSLQGLYERLAEITEIEQELNLQLGTLKNVYDEMSTYNNQIHDQGEPDIRTFEYVRKGFENTDRILQEVQGTIDFQQLEAVRSTITLQINELEEKASKENTQANQHQDNSESPDETTSEETASEENTQVNQHQDNSESPDETTSEETASEENTQVNQHQDNSESPDEITSNQEASTNSNNNEEVTEHEEENIEHSE